MGQIERRKRVTRIQAAWHLTDVVAVVGGFLLGHLIRFSPPVTRIFPPRPDVPPLMLYLYAGFAAAVLWVILFHALGLYRAEGTRRAVRSHVLFRASGLGMLMTAAVAFFYREASFSRLAAPLIWILTFLLLRTLRRLALRVLVAAGALPPIRTALVGRTEAGWRVVRRIPRSGLVPQSFVGAFSLPGEPPVPAGVEDLGPLEDLGVTARRMRLDRLVIALPGERRAEMEEAIGRGRVHDLDIDLLPDVGFPFRGGIAVEEIGGLVVIRPRDLPLAGWNGVVKRAIDLVVSAVLLVLLAPVLAACALAVRLDSPGPVLYRQERVGRDRRSFSMLKFRSMRVAAEEKSGPVWASEEDPRRTRVGRFLRTWSLDELPQLWNVFRGDMSLVGPRPERPTFVQQFYETVPEYYGRHRIKAGLTGWAQVNGLRGNVPIEERTRYDVYYIENWSHGLDFRILLLTLKAVIVHHGS